MRVMTFSILLLVVACGACSSSGTGKSPGGTPPENSPPPAASPDAPLAVTLTDLTCDVNADCTEIFVWMWDDKAKGYCTGCTMQAVNQEGARRLSAWYQPRAGRGCPMHDCERPTVQAACVENRCAHVPITPATGD
jgi:hypothetical protein